MILTGFMVALRAFFVANSIPFFKDVVVALIGAFTSVVPLMLLLPSTLFHRLFWAILIWCPTKESLVFYALIHTILTSIHNCSVVWIGGFHLLRLRTSLPGRLLCLQLNKPSDKECFASFYQKTLDQCISSWQ
jgi:hypothetical protein